MFELDRAQLSRLDEWVKSLEDALVREQLQSEIANMIYTDESGRQHPYLGAIGGGLTYEFTPTSLGTAVKVTWCKGTPREAQIDLTDYDSW